MKQFPPNLANISSSFRPSTNLPLLLRQRLHVSRAFSTTRPRCDSDPTEYPERTFTPSSSNHHDLPSFLAYANRASVSSTSTLYVGTRYEYIVLDSLCRYYGFDLTRVGGVLDDGIDLIGTWNATPPLPRSFRVLVQCKALRSKAGPNHIRELEGSFLGSPAGWQGDGVLGIFASTREATRGVRDALAKSRYPLIWFLVGIEDGDVKQALWNQKARDIGLQGLAAAVRFNAVDGLPRSPEKASIVLTWDGQEVKPRDA